MTDEGEARIAAAALRLAVLTVRWRLLERPVDVAELSRIAAADDDAATAGFREDGATFVTLERDGRLRGCIGSLLPFRSLASDVARNAVKSMKDPRLPEVTADEWPGLSVSISLLSKQVPLEVDGYAGLCAALRPGVDGLTLHCDGRRATFLPSVWEKTTTADDFVTALLRKGGWPTGELPDGMTVTRYTTRSRTSAAPRPPLELS